MRRAAVRGVLAIAVAGALTLAAGQAQAQATPTREAGSNAATHEAPTHEASARETFFGTREPFAAHAVYFVLTDRFVNGDPGNDHRDQGGAFPTFDRPTPGAPAGRSDNIGYLGGDFRGLLDNAAYIRDLGFGAVWLTPIVDNPDEAFAGGEAAKWSGMWTDRGKTGYHGYWGVNFYALDEHLPSRDLDFRGLTAGLKRHGLKTVLDIVGNHGSPSYSAPLEQPKYGELYDRDGRLVADHQNLHPTKLDPANNPLHRWYHPRTGLAQLSEIDDTRPEVRDYFVGAYSQWIEQGADAFRIDTIQWMPHAFWHEFSARIRAKRPGFFMFAEAFDHDAATIAQHTLARNAGVSVLDFPLKERLAEAFGRKGGGYERVAERLYLTDGPYANPYELMTFYDNHDMARLDARDEGFIDAHHFLFTARGIPVIYYGSEVGFERGTAEHAGNRNYFGQQRIEAAKSHRIHNALRRIARLREATPVLQRGVQVNLEFQGDRAAFLRVLQDAGAAQTALVLLNKGDTATDFRIERLLQHGRWRRALGGATVAVGASGVLETSVPAHGVEVFVLDAPVTQPALIEELRLAMARKDRAG